MLPLIPLELTMMIDIPSMCVVGMGTILPSAVTRGTNRVHLLEGIRRLALPAGLFGTLVGFIAMLTNMSDPTALAPSFQIAMLSSWYGFIVYMATSWMLRKTNDYQLSGQVQPSVIGSSIIALGILYFLFSYTHVAFIDFTSIGFFVLASPLFLLQKQKYPLSYRIMRGGVMTGLFGMTFGLYNLFQNISDPTAVGPAIAVSTLSSLYAALIIMGTSAQIPTELSKKQMRWQYVFWGANIALLYGITHMLMSFFI